MGKRSEPEISSPNLTHFSKLELGGGGVQVLRQEFTVQSRSPMHV